MAQCDAHSVTVGYLPDITYYMKKHPVTSIFKSFSPSQLFLLLRFFCSVPLLHVSNWRIYVGFIKFIFIYKLSKTIFVKDYVVVDHGFFQSVGSLTYGKTAVLSDKSKQLLSQLFLLIDIDCPVFCHITADLSLQRIRQRNRQSKSGRLDLIDDNDKLKNALETQSQMFESIYSLCSGRSLYLEMDNEVEKITAQMLNDLSII